MLEHAVAVCLMVQCDKCRVCGDSRCEEAWCLVGSGSWCVRYWYLYEAWQWELQEVCSDCNSYFGPWWYLQTQQWELGQEAMVAGTSEVHMTRCRGWLLACAQGRVWGLLQVHKQLWSPGLLVCTCTATEASHMPSGVRQWRKFELVLCRCVTINSSYRHMQ